MRRLAIILALLLPACAGDLGAWRLGAGFDGTTREDAFRAAAAQWCQAAELCAEIADDGANVVQVSESLPTNVLGWYEPDADGATISVLPGLPDDELLPILLHELGHHWGCDDNHNSESNMYYADDGAAKRISPSDVECAQ